jgi:hypothetical protein
MVRVPESVIGVLAAARATPPPARLPVRTRPWSWLAACTGCFLLYAMTASDGPQWQDSGLHILRIVTGELVNPLGLALSHPLHFWIGRMAIWPEALEPGVAITLVSAAAAAVTVANVFGGVLTLTASRCAAWFAGLSLAVAATFWQMATIAESYTLSTALLSAELWCLALFARTRERHWLIALALCNGLGIANHMLGALTTPVVLAVWVYARRTGAATRRDAWLACACWVAGTLPYSGLIALEMWQGGDPALVARSALVGGTFGGSVLNATLSARMLLVDVVFPAYNFPNLLIPAACYGLWTWWRRADAAVATRALVAALAVHVLFAFRYDVVDQHTFFLPVYTILAMAGGLGAAATLERPAAARATWVAAALALLVATPGTYVLAASWSREHGVLDRVARNKPYRDDYTYLLIPWASADRSAGRMSREALELAGHSGLVVIEDRMAEYAVRYLALRDGAGTTLVSPPATNEIAEAVGCGRVVVLVPANADHPRLPPPAGWWQREGDLYRLVVPVTDDAALCAPFPPRTGKHGRTGDPA